MPNTKNILIINETRVPGICSYRIDFEDIDSSDSRRGDETGVMHRRRLRKKVKKVFVKQKLTDEDVEAVTGLLEDPVINMTIYCPAFSESNPVEGEFYVSKASLTLLSFFDPPYWELSFNAVEM